MSNQTFKAIALIKRKPGTSRDDFAKHYETVHVPLALETFKFSGYIRNHIIQAEPNNEPGFDVFSMFWNRDMDELVANYERFSSSQGDAIRADELTFMEPPKNRSFMVSEQCDDAEPWSAGFCNELENCQKLITLVRSDSKSGQNYAHVEQNLETLLQDTAQVRRYVHNKVLPESEDTPPEFSYITEIWIKDTNDAATQEATNLMLEKLKAEPLVETIARVNPHQTVCK